MDKPNSPDAQEQADAQQEALVQLAWELAEMRRERDALAEAVRLGRARETALGNEVQHRIRNMLAVIRSLLGRTLDAGSSPEEFADHFRGRLDAIARYQVGAGEGQRRTVDLEDVIRDELLPTRCLDTPACVIAGPAIAVEGDAIEPIALAVHELATNAFKFGALSGDGGTLDIGWSLVDDADGAVVHFRWSESGAPVIAAKADAYGFGRQFIEEALPYQLGASTSFDLRPDGFVCTIVLPVQPGVPAGPHASPNPRIRISQRRDDR